MMLFSPAYKTHTRYCLDDSEIKGVPKLNVGRYKILLGWTDATRPTPYLKPHCLIIILFTDHPCPLNFWNRMGLDLPQPTRIGKLG